MLASILVFEISATADVQSTQDLEVDRRRLQETLRREVEARKRVDKMLRGYKDEVKTLDVEPTAASQPAPTNSFFDMSLQKIAKQAGSFRMNGVLESGTRLAHGFS